MNNITLAAAFAAGLMSFAANAQEAPVQLNHGDVVSATKATDKDGQANDGKAPAIVSVGFSDRGKVAVVTTEDSEKAVAAKDKRTARNETPAASVEFADRGMTVVVPAVDTVTTGSIAGRKSPELVATARNEKTVTGKSGKVTSSGQYGAIIARYAATYGVPVSLAHAVIRIESNYRPGARGRAGEVGLMQIKPATARGLGYSGSVKALYNPDTNIRWGMKYLGMAHKLSGGTTCGTILKYNAGHGAKRMNPVSAAYCSKVKRHMGA